MGRSGLTMSREASKESTMGEGQGGMGPVRGRHSKTIGVVAVVLLIIIVSGATFGIAKAQSWDEVQAPAPITSESRCPVAGCTSSECHGPGPAPELEEGQVMYCPRITSCSSDTCHEQGKLTSHYRQANDLSLNLWIVGLGIVGIAAYALVKKL